MKIKTCELTGAALDWAVAKCEGFDLFEIEGWEYTEEGRRPYEPSTDWAIGGPLIELSRLFPQENWGPDHDGERAFFCVLGKIYYVGPTPLIAAMRAFVASALGDEVEVPKELAT